jgi:hypothetical protein
MSISKFYVDINISGMSEQLLCLIQRDHYYFNSLAFLITIYDPVKGTWERIPPFGDPHFNGILELCQCVFVN